MAEMICPYQKKITTINTLDKLTVKTLEEFSECKGSACPFYIKLNGERDRCAKADGEKVKRNA